MIGDILNSLSKFQPFTCKLNEVKTFGRNGVIYLEPDRESQSKIAQVYKELKQLFQDTNDKKWKQQINPHMTISQPVDRKTIGKNYAEETLNKINNEIQQLSTHSCLPSFTIDSIYWIKRTETTPFQIEFAFPLGNRYPPTLVNLDAKYLTTDDNNNNILNYLYKNDAVLSLEADENFVKNHTSILNLITKSLCSIEDINQSKQKSNQTIHFETGLPNYNALITVGSFQHGMKSNDLDFSLIHYNSDSTINNDEFKKRLT